MSAEPKPMPVKLHIAEDLSLPLEAVTQTFGAVGRKGSGKTYLATMLAEQMLDAGAQVVAVDPVGNWWGLRVGSDGKSKGKEIFVLGGDHGDLPLAPEAGPRIARLIVEKNLSAVLDVSSFRIHERKRFGWEFGEELLHLKKRQRSAMHLFIEEAQLLVPQRFGKDEARMVGAFEQLVRLGRNYGIGSTLVSQRPQSVNKEVLSQVECLCVLQVTGPHERKALEEWVQEAGADRQIVGELPGLRQGEGYVWSPAWLRIWKRVRFAKKQTFDASATPEVGRAAKAASLTAVDVEALRADLAEMIEKAKAEDPRALRQRIQQLEAELRKKPAPAAAPDPTPAAIEQARVEGRRQAVIELSDALMKLKFMPFNLRSFADQTVEWAEYLRESAAAVEEVLDAPKTMDVSFTGVLSPPPIPSRNRLLTRAEFRKDSRHTVAKVAVDLARDDGKAGDCLVAGASGLRRMLIALAQRNGMNARQLGVRAGLSSSSGTFGTYLGRARSEGWITGGRDTLEITEAGLKALGSYEPLPEGRELLEYWLGQLRGGAGRMLEELAKSYPRAMSAEELGEAANLAAGSGTFGTYLGKLRTLELVHGRRSELRASEELF